MNRKQRKARKMVLRRQGLEIYKPDPNSIITISPWNVPDKIRKHFKGDTILVGKMKGYEFTRLRAKKVWNVKKRRRIV